MHGKIDVSDGRRGFGWFAQKIKCLKTGKLCGRKSCLDGIHKKMLKMKVAPNELLKTKGQKSAPTEFMKIKELTHFYDELLKIKDIG